jgi:hypothetical protein
MKKTILPPQHCIQRFDELRNSFCGNYCTSTSYIFYGKNFELDVLKLCHGK